MSVVYKLACGVCIGLIAAIVILAAGTVGGRADWHRDCIGLTTAAECGERLAVRQ